MSEAAGCRILLISPTAARAHQFVERLKALPTSRRIAVPGDHIAKVKESTSVSTNSDHLAPGSCTSIPWTIANKYYTADVHFETHELEHFKVHHAIGVPAIIYVWGTGEPFREHIPEIAQKVQHHEPEVSLAVRLGDSSAIVPSLTTSGDDDGLDEFLSSHGFEFIEGDRNIRRPTHDRDGHSEEEDSGIPGLPRVIDALSTIMWPSLVQSEATQKRKSRARDMIGWAFQEEGDDGLRALIADPGVGSSDTPNSAAVAVAAAARKSRMQREMEELERWLEDEETESGRKFGADRAGSAHAALEAEVQRPAVRKVDDDANAWGNNASVGWDDTLTPPTIRTPHADHTSPDVHGFEDDFADFVSATSHPRVNTLDPMDERLLEVHYDVGRLTPMHTGVSYRSLGSTSDFGGDDGVALGTHGEYGVLEDEDGEEEDPELPSRAEIFETSRRLFGAAAFAPAPESSFDSTDNNNSETLPATARSRPHPSVSLDSAGDVSLDSEEGDESVATFDLSRVFSALQGMKEEIAGMGDENERRRAAARVALGLVYGLGVDGDNSRG